jgi:hypothetical protein
LSWPGLICARKAESKCARITWRDKGTSAMAPRNQVSCLPTAAAGTAVETKPLLPCEPPLHPAAAPATATPSQADQIRLAVLFLAERLALSYGQRPAELTRRPSRRPRSQNQFMSFPPLTVGLVRPL